MSLTLDHTLVPTTIIIRESIRHRFAAQLDLDDAIGQVQNPGLTLLKTKRNKDKRPSHVKNQW
jgi:hypothetical protein